tara:strand:- start:159 stop:689 length:531 start_codon:yes stop_codon:yes gene_type:complete
MKYDIKKIEMIISDVDGVLTDGTIYKGTDGQEFKKFTVHDGVGVAMARAANLKIALISGRYSPATEYRAKELKINDVYNGGLNKILAYEELKRKYSLNNSQIAYLGDDLIDIPVMKKVALPIAVANASKLVKNMSQYITEVSGGHGALRDAVEWIIDKKGITTEVLEVMRKKIQSI